MENTKKKLIVIGAGSRGKRYTDNALHFPDLYEVVAVAEPIDDRRLYIKNKHGIPDGLCFSSWEPLLALPKLADIAIIATMDRDHIAPAIAAIRAGYDLLLEKPVCPTPEECYEVEREAKKHGAKVLVGHVLRFTPFFRAIKSIIDSGELGKIINIQHREDVWNVHQTHSFVRGNWGNTERSSCMILQKCCHDMDILRWLLGKKCTRVQSFGSLSYFTRENAPEGAPEYCLDGCPHSDTCPYEARRVYIENGSRWFRTTSSHKVEPTDDDVLLALRTTQYGKCVFKCDNDVVDHQVVNLEFEDGATVNFSMCAFNEGGRYINIMGTKGELRGVFKDPELEIYDFLTRTTRKVAVTEHARDNTISGGHGGGDDGIMAALYDLVTGKENFSLCTLSESVDNHMIAFAAEESRLSGKVVDLEEFKNRYRG